MKITFVLTDHLINRLAVVDSRAFPIMSIFQPDTVN